MSEIEISIIIATRNREQILWETVEKACIAIENKTVEIIIINDGDSSMNVPDFFVNKIHFFNNPKKGVSSARNFGATKAKGNVYFFIDDDMWINREILVWIKSYMILRENTEAVYCINWEYPPYLKNMLTKTKIGRYLLSTNYHTLWGRLHEKNSRPAGLYQIDYIGSGSLVIHKKIFEKAGGYNETLFFQGEDNDLKEKLKSCYVKMYIFFDITLYHNHSDRLEINNFLRRIYDGFGSEFKSVKDGAAIPLQQTTYKGFRKLIFELSRVTEKGWISFFSVLPNLPILTPLNNKLIGALGGLQRYKQWRNIIE